MTIFPKMFITIDNLTMLLRQTSFLFILNFPEIQQENLYFNYQHIVEFLKKFYEVFKQLVEI